MIREAREIQEEQQSTAFSPGAGGVGRDSVDASSTGATMGDSTMVRTNNSTLLAGGTSTLASGTMIVNSSDSGTMLESELGTMIINDSDDDSTMRRIDTARGPGGDALVDGTAPKFLGHFAHVAQPPASSDVGGGGVRKVDQLQKQTSQMTPPMQFGAGGLFQKSFLDGDFEFLHTLSYEELQVCM